MNANDPNAVRLLWVICRYRISIFLVREVSFVYASQYKIAGVPYEMKMDDENNLHNAVYILLTLIVAKVETEVRTSHGHIDLVLKTPRYSLLHSASE
ncbi:MAG: PD-(D/E)XK nuclease domain-containing protein [Muribaculaceae bacterium]|nr:PD-(D/E)XK nuclease domain-containing protein [Muribaculaceae bacterium]